MEEGEKSPVGRGACRGSKPYLWQGHKGKWWYSPCRVPGSGSALVEDAVMGRSWGKQGIQPPCSKGWNHWGLQIPWAHGSLACHPSVLETPSSCTTSYGAGITVLTW